MIEEVKTKSYRFDENIERRLKRFGITKTEIGSQYREKTGDIFVYAEKNGWKIQLGLIINSCENVDTKLTSITERVKRIERILRRAENE